MFLESVRSRLYCASIYTKARKSNQEHRIVNISSVKEFFPLFGDVMLLYFAKLDFRSF